MEIVVLLCESVSYHRYIIPSENPLCSRLHGVCWNMTGAGLQVLVYSPVTLLRFILWLPIPRVSSILPLFLLSFVPIYFTYLMYDLLSVVTTCTRLRVSYIYIDTCIPCSLLIILLLLLSSTIFTIGLYYIVQLLPNATDKSLKLKIWFVSRDLCDRFQGELLQRSKPRSTTFLH